MTGYYWQVLENTNKITLVLISLFLSRISLIFKRYFSEISVVKQSDLLLYSLSLLR